jgi:flagellar basal body rod protein FlgG
MDALTIAAASGLKARMESLDMLANNLANAATAGFKGDREFYGLYVSAGAAGGPVGGPAVMPVIERSWTDFSQGMIYATGNPLDVAISGRGLFSVDSPAGRLYTRNGSFRLSPAGVLTTQEGYPVRLAGGGTLQLAGAGAIDVSPDGAVRQNGVALGQIEVVEFADVSVLSKRAAGYFTAPAGAQPQPATEFELHQGKLEASNVSSAEGAVRLVSVIRQFEMLQRAVSLGAEMNRRAVEEVARVGA